MWVKRLCRILYDESLLVSTQLETQAVISIKNSNLCLEGSSQVTLGGGNPIEMQINRVLSFRLPNLIFSYPNMLSLTIAGFAKNFLNFNYKTYIKMSKSYQVYLIYFDMRKSTSLHRCTHVKTQTFQQVCFDFSQNV
jgi:hypothetical protein